MDSPLAGPPPGGIGAGWRRSGDRRQRRFRVRDAERMECATGDGSRQLVCIRRHRRSDRQQEADSADPVQAPPQGAYAAITDEANPDTLILYQDIALEAGFSYQLSLLAYYDTYKPIAVPTPDTLSVDEGILGGQGNQQFRIDVMKPDAPLESVDPADILRTVFATKPRDPPDDGADEADRESQRLRGPDGAPAHRQRGERGSLQRGRRRDLDLAHSYSSGRSPSGGSKHGGPVLFGFGKVRANRRNGTATLRVAVSGPGLLRATGAPTAAGAATSQQDRAAPQGNRADNRPGRIREEQ